MRRLEGAVHVQLDTEIQFARVSFGEPVQFDFPSYTEAATSAAYTTIAIRLTAPGSVERATCEQCAAERYFLRVDETGQWLELVGEEFEPGEHLEVEAEVRGWQDDHARLAIPGR